MTASLPLYPSTHSRKSLSPSQLITLNQTISSTLSHTLELPPERRDIPSARAYVSSYAKDAAVQTLESLIWGNDEQSSKSKGEKAIRRNTLLLAEKLSCTRNESAFLDFQTLLDLSIAYTQTNLSRIRGIISSAISSNRSLLQLVEDEVVPGFTTSLSASGGTAMSGLYGLRKSSYCIRCLILSSPPQLIRIFALNKPFMVSLAKAYDHGLSLIAGSYGGFNLSEDAPNASDRTIFLETKVAFIDSFHVLAEKGLVGGVISSGNQEDIEKIFDILLELVDIPAASQLPARSTTPYLNRPLMVDYQDAYDFSKTITTALRKARSDDSRTDLLEFQMRAICPPPKGSGERRRHPGALKLLLHSSGAPLIGIDLKGKGKARASMPSYVAEPEPSYSSSEDLDFKIIQVLEIFPGQSSDYVRALLEHPDYPFKGSPERVIEALLEGTAPSPENLTRPSLVTIEDNESANEFVDSQERRNVFDGEIVALNSVRIGKKSEDASSVLRDRSFMEQMKADILRRVEEMVDDEEDEEGRNDEPVFVDGLDNAGAVMVAGDGEESEDDEDEDDADKDSESESENEVEEKMRPETVLELAYLRDCKLFARDAQTRRSQGRKDLKAQSGWSDEQIEGWCIMLERNPNKDRILQKHEFSGNKAGLIYSSPESGAGASASRGDGGRGGRGGRGRGGGSAGDARGRAWKDKHKASRGNHNRKIGRSRKLAKAGAVPI